MSRAPLVGVVALAALALGGCDLSGDSESGASPPAALLAPAPHASPAAVALEGDDAFRARFKLRPPRAGILFDVDSGEVLWRRDPLRVRPIASLTKVMTALVATTATRPRDRVRVPREAVRSTGRKLGVFMAGRTVPAEALLSASLITSANDASVALAHRVGGSVPGFARLMNERARVLGLRCSRFVSPHGLEPGNRSCAADLAAMTRLAMATPRIARIARIPYTQIRAAVKGRRLYLAATNPLLAAGYRGTVGLKTGYTVAAGRCLIAVVRRGRRTIGAVLLGSPNPAEQAKRLIERAFASA
jgi:serine-type D-Ala-D-Ala carboxypeptidase (penicillin-binding protein 5/6)